MTLSDLLAFARSQATVPQSLYFEPGFARPDQVSACRSDRAKRDRQRRDVLRTFPGRVRNADHEALVPGRYFGGRLIIADGIDYVPGQWAALEIWPAVMDYLIATNACEA